MRIIIDSRDNDRGGVFACNVKAYVDRQADRIDIYGDLISDGKTPNLYFEPDVVCLLMNSSGRVHGEYVSEHAGCFWVAGHAVFHVSIDGFRKYFSWFDEPVVRISVIYRRSRNYFPNFPCDMNCGKMQKCLMAPGW